MPHDCSAPETYALTLCNGACAPGACLESDKDGVFQVWNLLTPAEAAVAIAPVYAPDAVIHSGGCGSQPRTCSTAGPKVCANSRDTYGNLCKAKVALRDSIAASFTHSAMSYASGACTP